MTLQIEHLHLALNLGVRMMVTFVSEGCNLGFAEF
jgi:hypothetical protein